MEQIRRGRDSWTRFGDEELDWKQSSTNRSSVNPENQQDSSDQTNHFCNTRQLLLQIKPSLSSKNSNFSGKQENLNRTALTNLSNSSVCSSLESPTTSRSINKNIDCGRSDLQAQSPVRHNSPVHRFQPQSYPTVENMRTHISTSRTTSTCTPDPWAVSPEQKAYYLAQFLRIQSDPRAKLSGIQSRNYFELSKLPLLELSKIWELADVDQDGQLTLGEFCAAMHLVVLRRNGVPVPNQLPGALLELVETNLLSRNLMNTEFNSLDHESIVMDESNSHSYNSNKLPYLNHVVNSPKLKLLVNHNQQSVSICPDFSTVPVSNNSLQSFNSSLTESKHRRWSLSSQSDIGSLTDGITLFESRPNNNSQLKHPIPLRVRTLPSNPIQSTTLDPENSGNSSLVNQLKQFGESETPYSHPNNIPYALNSKFITVNKKSVDSFTNSSNNASLIPHSSLTCLTLIDNFDQVPTSISSQSSLPAPPQQSAPPPPPPRAHLLITNIDQDQFDGNVYLSSPPNLSSNQTKILTCGIGQISPSLNESDNVINLQTHCDQISQINEQLAFKLMRLQKDRIALKILLERLMPLETT